METRFIAGGPVRCMYQADPSVQSVEVEFVAEDKTFIAFRDIDGARSVHLARREKFRFERDALEVPDYDVAEPPAPPAPKIDEARFDQVLRVFEMFDADTDISSDAAATLTATYFYLVDGEGGSNGR